jgi:uncharacterized protein (DUF58 family)
MIATTVKPPASIAELLPPELAAQLDAVDILSRKLLTGKLQGERRGKRRGRSVEFDDYRPYVPGDDLRHIDWNVLARFDRFFIKLFQEEEDLSLDIMLDCSASMHAGQPDKMLFAARLASALGYLGLVHNNRVSVTCFGARFPGGPAAAASTPSTPATPGLPLRRLEPVRGRRNTQRLVDFVLQHAFVPPPATSRDAPAAMLDQAVRAVAGSPRGAKGVLVLISDMLIPPTASGTPGYQAAIRTLAAAGRKGGGGTGYDAYILQTLAPAELDPSSPSGGSMPSLVGDLRLTDAETGRAAELTVAGDLVTSYRKAIASFNQALSTFCIARGISHLTVPTDIEVASLVLGLLRRRGMVG